MAKIYVDSLVGCKPSKKWPYNQACHLFTDIGGLDLLHHFAHQLGLKKSWFQSNVTLRHYDLTPNKRKLAVKHGAVELSNKETVEIIRNWRSK